MPTKTIVLSQDDLASVQRLLSNLADAPVQSDAHCPNVLRLRLLKMAQIMLAVRQRRAQFLHQAMLGEPAYDMLLGLYVLESSGEVVTSGRLAEHAGVPQSSAMRWIDYLVTKQLIHRDPHPKSKRSVMLTLAPKGRDALESVFRTMIEGLQEMDL